MMMTALFSANGQGGLADSSTWRPLSSSLSQLNTKLKFPSDT